MLLFFSFFLLSNIVADVIDIKSEDDNDDIINDPVFVRVEDYFSSVDKPQIIQDTNQPSSSKTVEKTIKQQTLSTTEKTTAKTNIKLQKYNNSFNPKIHNSHTFSKTVADGHGGHERKNKIIKCNC